MGVPVDLGIGQHDGGMAGERKHPLSIVIMESRESPGVQVESS